jgi:hypothetical protein
MNQMVQMMGNMNAQMANNFANQENSQNNNDQSQNNNGGINVNLDQMEMEKTVKLLSNVYSMRKFLMLFKDIELKL